MKKELLKLLLISVLSMISLCSNADCYEVLPFKETYLNTCQKNDGFFIIKGVAQSVYEHGRTIKVIEDLKGNFEGESSVFVWGIGGNCFSVSDDIICLEEHRMDNIIQYQENDTLIMLLGNPRVFEWGIETSADYATIECAASVLKLSNGFVTGYISSFEEKETVLWEDLQALCSKANSECGRIDINENEYITMQIVPEKISNSNKLRFENHTETNLYYIIHFSLEYYRENKWVKIYNCYEDVSVLPAGETTEEQIYLYSLIDKYNGGKKGKYRIMKYFIATEEYNLCAEFEIEDDIPTANSECGKIDINENEYISMQVIPDRVSSSSSNKWRLENYVETVLQYNSPVYLEYYIENTWVSTCGSLISTINILPTGTAEDQVDIYSTINECNDGKKGRYRIITKVFSANMGYYDLCAEFEVVDDDVSECGRIDINENEYIAMQVVPDKVSSSSTNKWIMSNQTEESMSYGTVFFLEYLNENVWTPIQMNDIVWTLPLFEQYAGTALEVQSFSLLSIEGYYFVDLYSLLEHYNDAKKGKYRIIKKVDHSNIRYDLCAEFEIVDDDVSECGRIDINENEYVTMQVLPEKISSNTPHTFRLENHTKGILHYGYPFSLEYFNENHWEDVQLDFMWEEILLGLWEGEIKEGNANYYSLIEYNNGKKGKYRIIKDFSVSYNWLSPSEAVRSFKLCAEFEVVDDNLTSIPSVNVKNNIYQWDGTIFFENQQNKVVELSFYDLSGKLLHEAKTTSNSYRPVLAGNIFVCKININEEIYIIKYIVP